MPKRTDIGSIMVIGAGPIVIGQACEFDYSGTQACKALKDEGYRVILVNSNPATIMTDPEFADATYIEPITPDIVGRIVAAEKPDALLPTMGGQTALNTALALADDGTLARHGVDLIGASRAAIEVAEDREAFREAMKEIGLECPKSRIARSLDEARQALDLVGLPTIIRPSYTLGGTGGGIAYNRAEFAELAAAGIAASPAGQILVEESVLGWKEFEMEVVRDKADNAIIVCSIENLDPMGIHTGDSITVAPALTLTDKEYQLMRNAAIAVLRKVGVETGGSNVQFAVDPATGRLLVIEMNPRVSRSSALASKATGFPIAKVAARLAVGYTLDEIANDITGVTPASFEPAIDYVVTKVPRFAFEKFPGAEPLLTTSMKSVGEAMAIGRTFCESLQKALRSMETGLTGLDEIDIPGAEEGDDEAILAALGQPRPDRLLVIAEALRRGVTIEVVHRACAVDPWFLREIEVIVRAEAEVRANGLPGDAHALRRLKALGFGDRRLATLADTDEAAIAAKRAELGVHPVFKRIDTCAAEFESRTPYMYSCYETASGDGLPECEAEPSDRRKVVILGGGPNRIGQGIEFDYCCVHAAYALKDAGFETIMVNCNPETVSTDYDTSDRLYFEPLTIETVLDIVRVEQSAGELVGLNIQFGGQTPLRLAKALEAAGVPILGTAPDAIDLAEDRDRFRTLLGDLGLRQPANETCTSSAEARAIAERIGYPVVVRPSYVLGGRAMEIVNDSEELNRYMRDAAEAFGDGPILLDRYLKDAIEVDVDALADGENVAVAGILEHIEEAGIHSGDSACALPPHSLGRRDRGRNPPPDHCAGPRARRLRPDERAVRRASRHRLCTRGQPAGEPHRALRRQEHRRPDRKARGARDGRRAPARGDSERRRGASACRSEGSGVPLRALPWRGHGPRAGDEVHRRGHGHRPRLRQRLRQGADRRRHAPSGLGPGLRLGAGRRQARRCGDRPQPGRARVRTRRHQRHPQGAGEGRDCRCARQQGTAGPPAHRRCHQGRHHPARGQHHGGRAGTAGELSPAPRRARTSGPLLHDALG